MTVNERWVQVEYAWTVRVTVTRDTVSCQVRKAMRHTSGHQAIRKASGFPSLLLIC